MRHFLFIKNALEEKQLYFGKLITLHFCRSVRNIQSENLAIQRNVLLNKKKLKLFHSDTSRHLKKS